MTGRLIIEECARTLIPGYRPHNRATPLHNPADPRERVGSVELGTALDVEAAVAAAIAVEESWGTFSASERAAMLARAAESIALATASEGLVDLLIAEHGKVRWEAELDLAGAPAVLSYYAGLAEDFDRETVLDLPLGSARVRRRPLGVTAVIVPWNYPVYLAFLMLVPALLAGNPVVVKPSELAPLALTRVLDVLARCLPPGVLTVVQGAGDPVGAALAAHPDVRGLFFTGSTATGKSIVRSSAGNLKRLGLELGGNDPAIVLPGTRLDPALMEELVKGTFTCSGQVCYSVKRIYVHDEQYDALVAALCAVTDELCVGPGTDPDADIGPLSNQAQLDKLRALVAGARTDGAVVHELGRMSPTAQGEGLFMLPTVVSGVDNEHPIVQLEQFGPVVPVVAYRDLDEAIALANASEYGLAASVWGTSGEAMEHVATHLQTGTIFINAHRIGSSPLELPFGGFKQSGLGRRHGFVALEESSQLQVVATISQHDLLPGPKDRT